MVDCARNELDTCDDQQEETTMIRRCDDIGHTAMAFYIPLITSQVEFRHNYGL